MHRPINETIKKPRNVQFVIERKTAQVRSLNAC